MKKFPDVIPVFPLSGVIYFPKTNLPLNIFEQRYLDLVNDAYNKDGYMGMVQSKKEGETVYDWNGFPCTSKDSRECCNDGSKRGECVATSKGGYCKSDDGNFTFRRGDGTTSRPYIKRSNDNILDVNDARDMQDYFYERKESAR